MEYLVFGGTIIGLSGALIEIVRPTSGHHSPDSECHVELQIAGNEYTYHIYQGTFDECLEFIEIFAHFLNSDTKAVGIDTIRAAME